MGLFDFHATRVFLEEACAHYSRSAPALSDWLDEFYATLADNPRAVTVFELMQLQQLREGGDWEQPNYAQNRWYKVRYALGKDCGVLSY